MVKKKRKLSPTQGTVEREAIIEEVVRDSDTEERVKTDSDIEETVESDGMIKKRKLSPTEEEVGRI